MSRVSPAYTRIVSCSRFGRSVLVSLGESAHLGGHGLRTATVSMSPCARGRKRRAVGACGGLSAAGWSGIALLLCAALSPRLAASFGVFSPYRPQE